MIDTYMLTVLAVEQRPELFNKSVMLNLEGAFEESLWPLYIARMNISSSYTQNVDYAARQDAAFALEALCNRQSKSSWFINQYFIRTQSCKQTYLDLLNSFEDNELRKHLLNFYKDLEDK